MLLEDAVSVLSTAGGAAEELNIDKMKLFLIPVQVNFTVADKSKYFTRAILNSQLYADIEKGKACIIKVKTYGMNIWRQLRDLPERLNPDERDEALKSVKQSMGAVIAIIVPRHGFLGTSKADFDFLFETLNLLFHDVDVFLHLLFSILCFL